MANSGQAGLLAQQQPPVRISQSHSRQLRTCFRRNLGAACGNKAGNRILCSKCGEICVLTDDCCFSSSKSSVGQPLLHSAPHCYKPFQLCLKWLPRYLKDWYSFFLTLYFSIVSLLEVRLGHLRTRLFQSNHTYKRIYKVMPRGRYRLRRDKLRCSIHVGACVFSKSGFLTIYSQKGSAGSPGSWIFTFHKHFFLFLGGGHFIYLFFCSFIIF